MLSAATQAQVIEPAILQKPWKASWITVPGTQPDGYGVYLFRKQFNLPDSHSTFIIHVSADNRYKLFVNEQLVSLGPARGDITHWNFETVDIAPYLKAGQNSIAASVWNESGWRPEGQISLRTGFIMQGAASNSQQIYTDTSWRCIMDSSYNPVKVSLATYYVAGPGEQVDMKWHIKGWEKDSYNDRLWKKAQIISQGLPKNFVGEYGNSNGWMLVPSAIPQMELKQQRLVQVRESAGLAIPASFPATTTLFSVPANSVVTILLDQTYLTNAYPTIIFSGGKAGSVILKYAEGLFTAYPAKGNRNETGGKIFMGRKDSIISDGTSKQTFTSLSWRTYRYIQLSIVTKEEPLILDDIYGTFTGYPFEYKAKLSSENPEIINILNIGWRTARLCAMETYMDCPYYEQLQYIGDARIQGMISLYNSGDDRLLRNAINQMDNSRQPEGVTLSRHPSFTPQYIPTFSLWYVGMLHDYFMCGADTAFVRNKLMGARQVLQYFQGFQQKDGSLKNVPYWMFTDWVETKGWTDGVGPTGKEGNSSLQDLQLLWAYQLAADMEERIGMLQYASLYLQLAEQLKKTIRIKYWDNERRLFADRLEKDLFSQHANALAILTGTATKNEAAAIANKLLSDTTLAPASIYFKYYLHQALVKAGLGNNYLDWLNTWRDNIKMGMTTWAEISDINSARSDCHAWGASPNIEFFRTVLGINSDAPAFSKVMITPHLGSLKNISGEIPHPKGKVSVQYVYKNDNWMIDINLPKTITGSLIWKKKTYTLKGGENIFKMNED